MIPVKAAPSLLALAALLMSRHVTAEGSIRPVRLNVPRPYGYVVGDLVRCSVDIDVDEALALDPASLPHTGSQGSLLELRTVDVRERRDSGRRFVRVDLAYQSFRVARMVRAVTVPGFALRFTAPGRAESAEVPSWSFAIGPLRPLVAEAEQGEDALRPDAFPEPLPVVGKAVGMVAASGIAATALAAWGGRVWRQRRVRHFHEAARCLRGMSRGASGPATARDAFHCVHQAFNRTLGEPLFAETLPDFFARMPRFSVVRDEIETFFAASYALFFGDPGSSNPTEAGFDLARLEALCVACDRVGA